MIHQKYLMIRQKYKKKNELDIERQNNWNYDGNTEIFNKKRSVKIEKNKVLICYHYL